MTVDTHRNSTQL